MARTLLIDEQVSPEAELVEAIIRGQEQAIGDLAWTLAGQVRGLELEPGGPPRIFGDAAQVVSQLVAEYSSVSGAIGPRLCYMSAEPVLRRHPGLVVPAFEGLQSASHGQGEAPAAPRRRRFGLF